MGRPEQTFPLGTRVRTLRAPYSWLSARGNVTGADVRVLVIGARMIVWWGRGLPLAIDRYYSSQSAGTSLDMGAGWSMSTGADVQLTLGTGTVTYSD